MILMATCTETATNGFTAHELARLAYFLMCITMRGQLDDGEVTLADGAFEEILADLHLSTGLVGREVRRSRRVR